jgi:hypothetical protein
MSTSAGVDTCERLLQGSHELRVGDVGVLGTLALLLAMQGDSDEVAAASGEDAN